MEGYTIEALFCLSAARTGCQSEPQQFKLIKQTSEADCNAFNLAQAGVSRILKAMKTFRIMTGASTILPLAMIVDSFLHPANYGAGTLGELLYPLFGIPILTFNMWAWIQPEVIEFYFLGMELEKD